MNQLIESDLLTRESLRPMPAARMSPRAFLQRLGAALLRWWERLWMDERTAYFSHAEDAVDLEYRIRLWNEDDGRGRTPLL